MLFVNMFKNTLGEADPTRETVDETLITEPPPALLMAGMPYLQP